MKQLTKLYGKKVPNDVYVEANTLDIGVSSAIISYNDGLSGLLDVMTRCGLDPGFYTKNLSGKAIWLVLNQVLKSHQTPLNPPEKDSMLTGKVTMTKTMKRRVKHMQKEDFKRILCVLVLCFL